MTANFDRSPARAYVTDVAAFSGGFIAIGSAFESAAQVGDEKPTVWLSVDGVSWEERPVDLGLGDVTLIGVAPRSDGRLLLVGKTPGEGNVPSPEAPTARSVVFVSDDGTTWHQEPLPVQEGAVISSFDHGPKGYVLVASGALFFSADGIDWTQTHEDASQVVAGDEGFVAMVDSPDGDASGVIASADGQTWYAADLGGGHLFDVAPVGGDWVAALGDANSTTVSHSADGLHWTEVLDVNDLTGPDGPKTGLGLEFLNIGSVRLSGGGGHAFLVLENNHCCAQMGWSHGVWSTTDGTTWAPAVEGDATVNAVATGAGEVVLGGHLGRGEDAAFWIGRP